MSRPVIPSVRPGIIQSLFRPDQGNGELIIHLKILEQVAAPAPGAANIPDEGKPRYMLLAVKSDGKVSLHKSKRNSNGTFSIGKSWDLTKLMALEVAHPQAFAITLDSKSYFWETDSPAEQINFLVAIVRSYRLYTNSNLRVLGFDVNERPGAPPPYVIPQLQRPPPVPRQPSVSGSSISFARSGATRDRPSTAFEHLPPSPQVGVASPVIEVIPKSDVSGRTTSANVEEMTEVSPEVGTMSPVVESVPLPGPDISDHATLANVEEMLEGFQWSNRQATGAAEQIGTSLIGELAALESASIHAIVESDDRVSYVIKHLDQAMAELDKLDQMISLYKTQLNVMVDDIDHIEGQNKGLQVQASNQRALLGELDRLLGTINIPEHDLHTLVQESLESKSGVERLEKAAISLYKAILSMRDATVGDMAAMNERFAEYHRHSSQFCKRVYDFLTVMFKYQADLCLKEHERMGTKGAAMLLPHKQFETYLERYIGLMLFIKEIDEQRYQQICGAYFATMSDLYKREISALFGLYKSLVRKPTEEELEGNFTQDPNTISALRIGALKRAVTVRSPSLDGKKAGDSLQGGEALKRAMRQLEPHVLREQTFVADLLHLSGGNTYTFADLMELETFFQRGAAAHIAQQGSRIKDVRSALELIFGFLNQELANFVDQVLAKDPMQMVGLLVAFDEITLTAQSAQNDYILRSIQRQTSRCALLFERTIKEQLKAIEQTRLTVKRRRGVAPFVGVLPLFIARLESQLVGAADLPVRRLVDTKYDVIISTMFECLQQMAKMDGESATAQGEDKDQLNYHVVLIDNMSHFMSAVKDLNVVSLRPHLQRARDVYDENLGLYIRLVLRRPFAKLLEFFQGLQQLLRTTPANEVTLHSAYNKASAKKVVSSLSGKDMRKAIETLSKRVDKHFTDSSNASVHNDVLKTVWQACSDETVKFITAWQSQIKRCYPDVGIGLDFTPEDVEATYKRNRPTGAAS